MRRHRPAVSLYEFMPYGAPELIESGPRHFSQAVVFGSGLWMLAFVLALWLATLSIWHPPNRAITLIPSLSPHTPEPPPAFDEPRAPPVPATNPTVARPGVIVPIPDAPDLVEPPAPPSIFNQAGEGTTTERQIVIPAGNRDSPPELEPDGIRWYYIEELPVAVHEVKPEYPEIPRLAGIHGLVRVAVLVDLDGSVRRAVIERSVPMLDEAALQAARQWRFKPGLANNRPVRVWVRIPFIFRLY